MNLPWIVAALRLGRRQFRLDLTTLQSPLLLSLLQQQNLQPHDLVITRKAGHHTDMAFDHCATSALIDVTLSPSKGWCPKSSASTPLGRPVKPGRLPWRGTSERGRSGELLGEHGYSLIPMRRPSATSRCTKTECKTEDTMALLLFGTLNNRLLA